MAKFVIPRPPASEFDSRVKQWKRVVPEDSARTLSRFFWLSGARGAGPKRALRELGRRFRKLRKEGFSIQEAKDKLTQEITIDGNVPITEAVREIISP